MRRSGRAFSGPGLYLVVAAGTVGCLLFTDATFAQARVRAGSGMRHGVARDSVKPRVVKASWYGAPFHGRTAANGRRFDQTHLTAAHRSWRLGSKVEVRNPHNGRTVVVEITDRGPFVHGREIDLSRAAAEKLGIVRAGVARVEVRLIDERGAESESRKVPVLIASATTELDPVWPRAITR